MKKQLYLGIALGLFAAHPALAGTIAWTDWTSSIGSTATGNIGSIGVSYSGNVAFAQLGSGTNYWTEGAPAPYTGNAVVSNAPTASELVATSSVGTRTITFSQNVLNPIMAILSMGQSGIPVSYDFDKPFTVLGEGRGYWGDGSYTLGSGDVLTGTELHGVIQFSGSISSISWASRPFENWHGFTVGLPSQTPVPEPGTMILLGTGLLGLAGYGRKRPKK